MATATTLTLVPGLRARKAPAVDAPIIGMLPAGAQLEVDHDVAVGDDVWHALPVSAGGVPLRDPSALSKPAFLYAAHRHAGTEYTSGPVSPPTPPPIPPAMPARTYPAWGLNFPSGNLHLVERAWQGGARAYVVIDDFLFATQLSERTGAFVVARRGDPSPYVTGRLDEDVSRMVQWLEGAAGGPKMHYVGLNEYDRFGFSADELAYRARFDVEMARRVRTISGATWVALSASMGTPQYPDLNICRVIREGYAEAYNAGLLMMDCHNYERNPEDITKPLDERRWYSARHEWLFGQGTDRCGFDPTVRGIVHCESGVDGGGGGRKPGGFLQFGLTGPEVLDFHRAAYRNAGAPIQVDGRWYPSPVVAGMYFQCGSAGWKGYEMTPYLDALAGNWTPE